MLSQYLTTDLAQAARFRDSSDANGNGMRLESLVRDAAALILQPDTPVRRLESVAVKADDGYVLTVWLPDGSFAGWLRDEIERVR